MAGPSVVALSRSGVPTAARVLARAFQSDPLLAYTLPEVAERAERAPGHFGLVLEYGLAFGRVLTTSGEPQGVAVWLPPGEAIVTPERAQEGGLDRLSEILGTEAADRFSSVLGALDPFHDSDVPREHWYVSVLGVDPSAQGLGIGRALLKPVMDDARASGLPCYLETANPANVGFYERMGFRVLRDFVEARSGLRLWTLRCDS